MQEVRPDILTLFDSALSSSHARVIENKERPWNYEGNIYWNRYLYEEIAHGCVDIGLVEADRRLFWVKLRALNAPHRVIVVCNVHLTWEGSAVELVTGFSPRVVLSQRIATFLKAVDPSSPVPTRKEVPYPTPAPPAAGTQPNVLSTSIGSSTVITDTKQQRATNDAFDVAIAAAGKDCALTRGPAAEAAAAGGGDPEAANKSVEPDGVVLCGDFNDRFHHRRAIRCDAGYSDVCSQLHIPQRTTWPTPSFRHDEDDHGGSDNVADWIFTHPTKIRAVTAQVVDIALDGVFPSDHYPLHATLQPVVPSIAAVLEQRAAAEEAAEFKLAAQSLAAQALSKGVTVTVNAPPATTTTAATTKSSAAASTPNTATAAPASQTSSGFISIPIPASLIAKVKAACPLRPDAAIRNALIDANFDASSAIRALS